MECSATPTLCMQYSCMLCNFFYKCGLSTCYHVQCEINQGNVSFRKVKFFRISGCWCLLCILPQQQQFPSETFIFKHLQQGSRFIIKGGQIKGHFHHHYSIVSKVGFWAEYGLGGGPHQMLCQSLTTIMSKISCMRLWRREEA